MRLKGYKHIWLWSVTDKSQKYVSLTEGLKMVIFTLIAWYRNLQMVRRCWTSGKVFLLIKREKHYCTLFLKIRYLIVGLISFMAIHLGLCSSSGQSFCAFWISLADSPPPLNSHATKWTWYNPKVLANCIK